MSREINVRVAKAMGLDMVWLDEGSQAFTPLRLVDGPGWFVRWTNYEGAGLGVLEPRRYSTEIAVARTMEDWIEEHHLNLRYTQGMLSVFLQTGCAHKSEEEMWWALIHATPEQRCLAFLAAMEARE